jgi:Mn-containing catalase
MDALHEGLHGRTGEHGQPRFSIGKIAPTEGLVNHFNDSTAEGDHGEFDSRGPGNEGDAWEIVNAPAFNLHDVETSAALMAKESSSPQGEDAIAEVLATICAISCMRKSSS